MIIKSTMHYVMGMYTEYPDSQVLQMIGRAGRPQVSSIKVFLQALKTAKRNAKKFSEEIH